MTNNFNTNNDAMFDVWNDNIKIEDIKNAFIQCFQTNLKYEDAWKNYPCIIDYLYRLSYSLFENFIQKNSYTQEESFEEVNEIMSNVELFLISGIQTKLFNQTNIENIINCLKDATNGFRKFEYLNNGEHYYGESDKDCIYLNKNLKIFDKREYLDKTMVQTLYFFHELGHKILNIYNNNNDNILKAFIEKIENMKIKKGQTVTQNTLNSDWRNIVYAFGLIEECLTQDMAETFIYFLNNLDSNNIPKENFIEKVDKGVIRSKFKNKNDLNCEIITNLDFYGIFQIPTIAFGKAMLNLKQNNHEIDTLYDMIHFALNHNFVKETMNETINNKNLNDNQLNNIFILLENMGKLYTCKYNSFTNQNFSSDDVQNYLNNINITSKAIIDSKNINILNQNIYH